MCSKYPKCSPQLHLPLNTSSSCVLCDSGISPPGNSLRKSFNKEARVGISSLSNSGKLPWSKPFLNSWQSFTFPLTLNRPLSLRPKHKHTFYKYTQSQHTVHRHWEVSNTLTMLLHKLQNVHERWRKTLPHLSTLPQAEQRHTKHRCLCFHLRKSSEKNRKCRLLYRTNCIRKITLQEAV